jgi:hypothetical protein
MTRAQGHGLILIAVLAGCGARDDSDPPKGYSNLAVYIDRKTGCEYLAANGASITPRRRADGSQVCGAPKE